MFTLGLIFLTNKNCSDVQSPISSRRFCFRYRLDSNWIRSLRPVVLFSQLLPDCHPLGDGNRGDVGEGRTLSNSAFCHRRKIIMKLRSLAPNDVKKC